MDEQRIRETVKRIPEGWMSKFAREFAIALMCYNIEELKKLIR